MPCYSCGKVQTDPVKGASPWMRGVIEGEQILICPECRDARAGWSDELEHCPRCGSTRLSIVMGSALCRECNHDWPARDPESREQEDAPERP